MATARKPKKKTKKSAVRKVKTTKTKKPAARKLKVVKEVAHDEACCLGCKVEGFVLDLIKSDHGNDREIGYRFQQALDDFNAEQEELANPRPIRGC